MGPAIGSLFEYNGRKYRVNSWLCVAKAPRVKEDLLENMLTEVLYESARLIDGQRLRHCLQDEATHVSGSGVGGCIAPIDQITITGIVAWPQEHIDEAEQSAIRLGTTRRLVA